MTDINSIESVQALVDEIGEDELENRIAASVFSPTKLRFIDIVSNFVFSA